jgi:response regulator RpfG family c-di-GMP phosphodiesterase/DNA-directed RNA polymerase subunit RPC12/RpoP
MELTCKQCGSKFRAALELPLSRAVRVACPSCGNQMVLKPAPGATAPADAATASASGPTAVPSSAAAPAPLRDAATPAAPPKRIAAIADEPRPFRQFLGEHLRRLGFTVEYFETGDPALEFVRKTRAELVIVNVYLKGKLGVEVSEEIKADAMLSRTRVILIGALFRANRFRANPTNLYGADEYIEEQIPEKEFRQIIRKLFPEVGATTEMAIEPREYDEARRLARLILSDIVIYHATKVERGIRENNFFDVLKEEIEEGRQYYESRVPFRVRQDSEIFSETLQQFVNMKREELGRTRTATQ